MLAKVMKQAKGTYVLHGCISNHWQLHDMALYIKATITVLCHHGPLIHAPVTLQEKHTSGDAIITALL
jgi:hypothetical protein